MNAHRLILFVLITQARCVEDLNFKIGLPEYVCGKDGGVKDVSTDMTSIRLLGEDAEVLNYKFDVNFHRVGHKCHNNQRCNLIVWKAVRELDHYLKNYPSEKLQKGLIEFNNTMLLPGVQYVLNVTLIDGGNVVKEKHLTLDYVDEEVKKSVKKPMASLLLLGPDTSYAYATYVVNAELTICSNFSSFHFKWEYIDKDGNTTLLPFKGAELKIPPETFQGLQTYTINSNLIADGASIAKAQQTVRILSRGLLLRLPFKSIVTRIKQPVRIKAFTKDFDNVDGELRFFWSCVDTTNNEKCEHKSDTSELDIESGFETPGRYEISLETSKGDFTETATCIVEVMEDAPLVEIEEIEIPIDPSRGVTLQTTIYDLKSFCTLQWTSVDEDGYEYLDLNSVPGDVDAIVNVTSKEDVLLQELEEFSNGTTNRQHDLKIPPSSESWKGLKGDVKYMFRLVIKCPISDENLNEINVTEPIPTETVTLTCDVILETNAAPRVQNLDVNPLEGEAFSTSFTFETEKAEDKEGDGPILYKFGYILNNRDVVLRNLGEVISCETTLPFSKDGIQTFLECCDNLNSCQRVLGPVIKTKLPQNPNLQHIFQEFLFKMNSEDYNKAFVEAFGILQSFKFGENDTKFNEVHDFLSKAIIDEINKYLILDSLEGWKATANDLIKNINNFGADLQLPEITLNKLIELRNKLSAVPEKYTLRKLLFSDRSKRNVNSLSLQDVRSYIEVSDLIISSSNDSNKINLEKENLRKQIHNYMEKLCSGSKKIELELKTFILSVEKLNKNSLNNLISIPFEGNSWHTMARIKLGNVLKEARQKCIGKAVFRDYLGKIGLTYYAEILNDNDGNTESTEITVYLPKNKSIEGNPTCLVYRNGWHNDCKLVRNIANYVKCSCKYLGYFYLEYGQQVSASATSSTNVIPTASSISNLSEKLLDGNETEANALNKPQSSYDTISYVVIVASVIGIVVLTVILKKIFHDDDDDEDQESETFDFPKYAQLHDEEFLSDAHI